MCACFVFNSRSDAVITNSEWFFGVETDVKLSKHKFGEHVQELHVAGHSRSITKPRATVIPNQSDSIFKILNSQNEC